MPSKEEETERQFYTDWPYLWKIFFWTGLSILLEYLGISTHIYNMFLRLTRPQPPAPEAPEAQLAQPAAPAENPHDPHLDHLDDPRLHQLDTIPINAYEGGYLPQHDRRLDDDA